MYKKRKALYITYIIILSIFISICSFFVCYFYNIKDDTINLESINVKENSKVNYNVILNNDDFYTKNNSNLYDIEELSSVLTNYSYDLVFSSNIKGKYSYKVEGYLDLPLKKEKIYSSKTNNYNVEGKVISLANIFEIDVKDIINKNKVIENNLNGNIIYEIKIDYDVYNKEVNKNIKNNKLLYINIPLSTVIHIDYSKTNEDSFKIIADVDNEDRIFYIVVVCEFLGAILLFVLLIVLMIGKINRLTNNYDKVLNKILKKNEDIIVKLNSLPDVSKHDVLFVSDFKDIKDAAYNLDKPINYINIMSHKQSVFIVLDKNVAYVYKLKESEIE